jgi:hypothetical protein
MFSAKLEGHSDCVIKRTSQESCEEQQRVASVSGAFSVNHP